MLNTPITRLFAVCVLIACAHRASAQRVDYARDVLPILSDACYHCHGPDPKSRKAKLRLDTKEGTFRVVDDVAVVVPGKSGESELIRRIVTDDPDSLMPPPDSNRKLTKQQIETLRRWVDQGAAWGTHWAFVPPQRPAIPAIDPQRKLPEGWPRNDIDRLVLARLDREGLAPAPQADKARLIRRVSLDLTGLPPTPAEIDAFLADASPDAYEKLIDRLLASPRYGERMAADWLDVARFADTHGYQMDRYRAVWPYRDWVIAAFNRNQPFDQFVTWQLAGDLLPDATKEQRLATAFNRLHMQNEEGGIVEEEFRVAYVVDRVNTMGTAFLGMTFECSRCHDHKYDPVTQKDFYSLFAFFQNIDESGQTTYFTDAMPVPTLLLSTPEQDKKLAEMRDAVAAAERDLVVAHEGAEVEFEKWLAARGEAPKGMLPGTVGAFDFETIGAKIENAADPKKPGKLDDRPASIDGKVGKAGLLDGDNGFAFPGVGHFSRATPFSLALWLKPTELAERAVVVHHSKAPIDAGSRGYELLLESGRVAFGLHHMWPGNSLKVVTKQPVPAGEWTHVTATYNGSSRAAGVRIYVNGSPAELEVVRDGLWKDITYGGGEPELAIGNRFRDAGFKGGEVDEFHVIARAITALEAAQLAGRDDLKQSWMTEAGTLTPARRAGLLEYFLSHVHEPSRTASAKLQSLRTQQAQFINPIPEIMAMHELPQPKPAHVLKRGAYDAPGEAVTAGTPAALPPFTADLPRNRLGLARWLLQPDHPLTARVTVNRLWQQMFGRGLVETADNFGSQGAQPSHPELLDYVARAFVDDMKWDVKRMLKTIAMSATYRQSSRATPELLARDRDNILLARGPARRLTAEMLRDQALFTSGLLVEKLGGPSVKPYQPDGIWDVAMGRPKYDRGKGPDLYRRSLYTFWKRTVAHPTMVTFDAADRSYCTVQRQSTSTPLQALALLNDVQMTEAARFIAQRMMKEGGQTPEERIAWAFRLVTGRAATDREIAVLRKLHDEQRAFFAADPASAQKLLAEGDSRNDAKLEPLELTTNTVLAIALLNHDDAVMRR